MPVFGRWTQGTLNLPAIAHLFLDRLADLLLAAAAFGGLYQAAAALTLRRFIARPRPRGDGHRPVTILKPVCGDDPGLYGNLRSFCEQDYGPVQIVLGVRDAADPAVAVVRRLMRDLPAADIALVSDGQVHGTNRKVSNLINMLRAARHEILVIADSDMRVDRDYLRAIVAELDEPGVGLVTCLYAGRPDASLWSRLHALSINHGFLTSVLVGQRVGAPQGCFGATIALTRDTLQRAGGLESLRDHLADDFALGLAVARAGGKVALSRVVVDDMVHEPSFGALFAHELRWARTMRSIAPVAYAASALMHPLPILLVALTLLAAAGTLGWPAAVVAALVLASRLWLVVTADRALGAAPTPLWLVAPRDVLSLVILIASYCGERVAWRGERFRVAADGRLILDGDPRA